MSFCSKDRPRNTVDKTGHHFINGCVRDSDNSLASSSKPRAHFHATHNFLRHTLFNCCKHSFSPAMEEPKHLFIGAADSRKRPDIHVSLSVKSTPFVNFAVDLTIVSPFVGVQGAQGGLQNPSDNQVLHPNKRADDAADKKREKYSDLCSHQALKFVPFVMYTTGKLHKEAEDFLELLAEQAAERRHISANVIKNYYLKLLSVCLVKRIGYVISTKVNGWQSNNLDLVEAYRYGNERANEIGNSRLD